MTEWNVTRISIKKQMEVTEDEWTESGVNGT